MSYRPFSQYPSIFSFPLNFSFAGEVERGYVPLHEEYGEFQGDLEPIFLLCADFPYFPFPFPVLLCYALKRKVNHVGYQENS